MKTNLLASAPTLERLEKCIREYFHDPTVLVLHPNGSIETGRGILSQTWRKSGRRYRFEEKGIKK